MTRALVTQMLEALEEAQKYAHNVGKYLHGVPQATTAAREYLATEPSGERADSAQWLREFAAMEFSYYSREATQLRKAADLLEADAQPRQVTCQIYGHVVGACVECNTHIESQQAKQVPMTWQEADAAYGKSRDHYDLVRAVENHHDITPTDKPTGWDNGLSQDYCKEFGQWLASRPGARQQIKAMFDTSTPLQP